MNEAILAIFQKAYQDLDLFPLIEPEDIEKFRVDYGREVMVRLRQEVNASVKDQKFVFAGHGGYGKSTLLKRFTVEMQPQHFTVFFSIADLLEPSAVTHRNILYAIAHRKSLPDPTRLASSLGYLANLYRSQGRYPEAEPLCLRALEISEQQLGATHPAVATSLNNLAALYHSQGRYHEAEPLYLRALAISEQQLGTHHPHTQTVWKNFRLFLQQVIRLGQTAQLSDHPLTQDLLRQMREGEE